MTSSRKTVVVALCIAVLLGCAAVLVRSRMGTTVPPASIPVLARPGEAPAPPGETPPPPAPLPGALRVLATLPEFALENDRGETVGLPDLRGTVWIADFIFTRCAGTCPMITQRMSELARECAAKPGLERVKFVSISVDPEHDRPAVLRDYGRGHGADPAAWMFLTGTPGSILPLVLKGFLLPVDSQADAAMPILHSQNFMLVDRRGRLRGAFDALSEEGLRGLRAALEQAVAEEPGTDVYVPADVDHPEWLEKRRKEQIASASAIAAPHDFRFTDRIGASGITFRHVSGLDTGKFHRPLHYDHGSAIAVADVDGDGLTDVFLVNQLGRNGLYRNLGNGRFADITEGSPVAAGDRACVGAAFADIDNDGDPDLLVTSVREGNLLFRNDGHGGFTDVTARSGLGDNKGHGAGAVFFDYDGDGRLDVFVANTGQFTGLTRGPDGLYAGFTDAFAGHLFPERSERSNLYHNEGDGVFTNVSESSGLVHSAWTGEATSFDADGDGRPDLYALSMQGHDELWLNRGDGHFEKKGRDVFPATPWGAMGVKVLDWNGDGRLDLFVADMHTDMATALAPEEDKLKHDPATMFPPRFLATDGNHVLGNALFSSQGGGKFVEVSDAANVETGWPWGPSAGDLNADGWPDLFVTAGMCYPFRYGGNSVLLNEGGKRFADAEFVLGVEPRVRLVRPWFDLESEGEDRNHPQAIGRAGHITVWAARGSRSSAVFDLEGDGDLDVVTNEFNDVPQVLVSDLAQQRAVRFVNVRLAGKRSNRGGIGAIVTLVASGRAQVQLNDGKSGYLAQGVLPLYFGLGDAENAESVSVTWPTGKVQVVNGPIKSGATVVVEEAP